MTKLVCILLALPACGKSNSDSTTETSGKAAPAKADAVQMCDRKLIAATDLAGLLPDPLTGSKPVGGDGCEFFTATEDQGGPNILVRFSPNTGRTVIASWLNGSMGSKAEPLAAVGDKAVWIKALKEVDAAKGDAMCAVQLGGGSAIMKFGDDLPQKLGAVCTKMFANARI